MLLNNVFVLLGLLAALHAPGQGWAPLEALESLTSVAASETHRTFASVLGLVGGSICWIASAERCAAARRLLAAAAMLVVSVALVRSAAVGDWTQAIYLGAVLGGIVRTFPWRVRGWE